MELKRTSPSTGFVLMILGISIYGNQKLAENLIHQSVNKRQTLLNLPPSTCSMAWKRLTRDLLSQECLSVYLAANMTKQKRDAWNADASFHSKRLG